jgi:hypothetical protein
MGEKEKKKKRRRRKKKWTYIQIIARLKKQRG